MEQVKYRKGYKYQLAETYTVRGLCFPSDNGILVKRHEGEFMSLGPTWMELKAGYASDGPSWPAIDTTTFMRGAFVHDGMYQAIRMGWLPESARGYADKVLRQMCLEDGMNPLRAWWVYKGLRVGGARAADPASLKAVLVAPA